MTRVQIETAAYSPPPGRRIPNRATYLAAVTRRQRLARVAGAPAVTLLVLGLLAAVDHWIPELGLGNVAPEVFSLFGTAVARPFFTGGASPAGGAPDAGVAPAIAFIAAMALGFASRQGGWARYAVAPAAVVLAAASVPIAVATVGSPVENVFSLLAALECVVIGAVVALIAVRGHLRRGVHPFARRVPGLHGWRTAWLSAYLLVLPVPFMVGRAIVGVDWRDRAAELAQSGSTAVVAPLTSSVAPLTWAVGAIVGVAVWAAMRFVPPIAELPAVPEVLPYGANARAIVIDATRPRLVAPAIAALVLLALGVALIAPAAADAAERSGASISDPGPLDAGYVTPMQA